MTETIEKYQSILSHIESLNLPEGQYLELVNNIRDVRNKHTDSKEHQWKPLKFELSINFKKLLTSEYETIILVIQSVKLNVPEHHDNYFSAKGFVMYDFDGVKHEFELRNINYLIESIANDYTPSAIGYKYGYRLNNMDAYKVLQNKENHEKRCREMNLLEEQEEDDDDDDYNPYKYEDEKYNKFEYMYCLFKSKLYNILRNFYFEGMEVM